MAMFDELLKSQVIVSVLLTEASKDTSRRALDFADKLYAEAARRGLEKELQVFVHQFAARVEGRAIRDGKHYTGRAE